MAVLNGGWGQFGNGGWNYGTQPRSSAYYSPPDPNAGSGWTTAPYAPPGAAAAPGVSGWYDPATGKPGSFMSGPPVRGPSTMPSANPAPYSGGFSGGLLSDPGYGEQFYTQNKDKFNQPTQAQQYWNGIQGSFATPYSADQFNGTYSNFLGQMSAPGQGTTAAYNYANQLGTPGQGEAAAGQASGYFGQQGTGERYINGLMNSGFFSTPGAAEDYYNQNSGFFTNPGTGEYYVQQNIGQLGGPGAAETNYGDAKNALAGINYGQQGVDLFNNMKGNAANSVGYFNDIKGDALSNYLSQQYDQDFRSPLMGKSYSEQLYDSGDTGLMDPYKRAQEKQQKVIDDQMAARGLYGSGAAIRAQEELAADTAAQNANARIGLANQADQQRLARLGQAQSFLTSASQDSLARRQLGVSAASAADQSQQGLMGLGLQSFNQASNEALGKVNLGTQAANASEQGLISRVGTAGNLALGAQNAATQRMLGGGQLARDAQDAALARTMGGASTAVQGQQLGMTRNMDLMTAGQVGQQLRDQRMFNAGNLGLSADANERARMDSLLNGAKMGADVNRDVYTTNRDTQKQGFDMTRQLTNDAEGRLLDQYNMSAGAQGLMETRLRNGLNDISANAQAQSSAVLSQLDAADQERFQAAISDIEAQMQSGKISQQYGQDQINQILQSAALLVKSKK